MILWSSACSKKPWRVKIQFGKSPELSLPTLLLHSLLLLLLCAAACPQVVTSRPRWRRCSIQGRRCESPSVVADSLGGGAEGAAESAAGGVGKSCAWTSRGSGQALEEKVESRWKPSVVVKIRVDGKTKDELQSDWQYNGTAIIYSGHSSYCNHTYCWICPEMHFSHNLMYINASEQFKRFVKIVWTELTKERCQCYANCVCQLLV